MAAWLFAPYAAWVAFTSALNGAIFVLKCQGGWMRRVVIVNDKMQQGYRYERSAPVGRDFDPQFRPDLTPEQMLELGVFCGKYLTDCQDEYPASWFARAKLSPSGRDCSLNYFGVDASQPLSEWRRKGWMHADDPRGWFQWYCRYYMGRRLPDEDARQIGRWKAMKRHVSQIRRHCEPGDPMCRPRQRQALLHWAYDSRKNLISRRSPDAVSDDGQDTRSWRPEASMRAHRPHCRAAHIGLGAHPSSACARHRARQHSTRTPRYGSDHRPIVVNG